MSKKILLVEDDRNISEIAAFNIGRAGYEVSCAFDGEDGLTQALSGNFDLILLDLMLPKMNGFEVCKHIREKSSVPVIMLTAREDETDKILGLDVGADDYVTKPYSLKELLARIAANIRRAGFESVERGTNAAQPQSALVVGSIVIDADKYSVTCDGKETELTKKEYELIVFLAKNKGQVFPREKILEQVWGYEGFYGDIRTVDVTVQRLRSKIERNPASPVHLLTKRGIGYYME